jgi:predicted nucleic acid-binding protein
VTLDALITQGERLLVETSTFIAHITGDEPISAMATEVIDGCVAGGRNEGVISAVSLGELLVHPHRVGGRAPRDVVDVVWNLDGLTVKSVDDLIAIEAARARALTGMRMSDAFILATGVLTSCDVLVTNDLRMASAARLAVPEMRVVVLSEVAAV